MVADANQLRRENQLMPIVRCIIEVTRYPTPKSSYEYWCGSKPSAYVNIMWGGLNIGNGYKARLVTIDSDGKRRIVARKWS